MTELGADYKPLMRKRRKMSFAKMKHGGSVEGAKGRHKMTSGGKATTVREEEKETHKDQDSQKTAWDGYAKGGGIHIKPSHKGLLHKDLGVAEGKKIPEKKLEKAKHSSDAAERKRATFAENAKHWNHKK